MDGKKRVKDTEAQGEKMKRERRPGGRVTKGVSI